MARSNRNDLTEGVIWRKLLGFFFPILFGMLFQQLYNTADAIIVGKYVGTDALAAVGGSPAVIINLVIGFFTGLASGATVVISQYFGAGDDLNLSRCVHTVITLCLLIGAVLAVGGYFFTPWALKVVNTPRDIIAQSAAYLRIYFSGAIPLMIFNVGSGILRAVGDSRRPLYYLVTCCLLNIVLDLLFVKQFRMGAAGAGWATVLSQTVSAVLILLSLSLSDGAHKLFFKKLRLYPEALQRTLSLGLPAGMQSAMYSISNLIIQIAVNGFGTATVAAWTACGKLDGVYWVTSNAFGVAICSMVGQCFGAGKFDRMKKSIRICLFLAVGTAVFMSTALLSFSRVGFRILMDDPAVIEESAMILTYFVPYYVIWSFIEILSGSLRGAGDSLYPTLIITLGVCLLRILWVLFVFPAWHTVLGVSVSYPVSWAATAIALILYYKKSNWLGRCSQKLPSVGITE